MSKRDDILNAALELFATRGFHGTSMPELAKKAGVGAGTIYRHFASKEALVNALYRHWKMALAQAVYTDLPEGLSHRARFREIWTRQFDYARQHPHAVYFIDGHHHGDYLDAESQQVDLMSAAALFSLVVEGQQDEVLVDLPPAAVIAIVYGSFLALLRGANEGYLELTDDLVNATEARAWAAVRR